MILKVEGDRHNNQNNSKINFAASFYFLKFVNLSVDSFQKADAMKRVVIINNWHQFKRVQFFIIYNIED